MSCSCICIPIAYAIARPSLHPIALPKTRTLARQETVPTVDGRVEAQAVALCVDPKKPCCHDQIFFVEFGSEFEGKHYFVGRCRHAIYADTQGGTEFAGIVFTSRRKISEERARKLNLGYLDEGIEAVRKGTLSYKLKTPNPH